MNNFPVVKDGKEYWISRSVAVVGFVFKIINDDIHILANKRGPGTPDFQGCWNCPCGYLDWNETLEQAVIREIREECGITIMNPIFIGIDSNPSSNRQNVTVRYYTIYTGTDNLSVGEGGEENEVSDIKWINVKDIDNYQWAFNHNELIKEILNYYDRN